VELAGRHNEKRPHSAIGMNTENLQVFATIAVPFAARETLLAIDVRLNGATIARFYVGHALPYRDNLHTQLMTGNPRVTIERHFAEVPTQVGPTNPDAMHPNQRFAGPRRFRFREINLAEMLGFLQLDGFHVGTVFRMSRSGREIKVAEPWITRSKFYRLSFVRSDYIQ
jgi:hypothetical protein